MNNNNFDDSTILDQSVETKKETTEKTGATEKKDASWKKVIIGSSVGYVLGTGTSILTASAMLRGEAEAPLSDEEQTEGYTPLFDSEITMATGVNDDMSFAEAFDAAREELGAGGVFVWHGNIYSTYTPEEWDNMSPEEQADFAGHFSWSVDPIDDSADDEVQTEEDEVIVEEEPVVEEIPVEQAAPVHEAAPQVVYTAQTSVVNDHGIPVATGVSDDMSFAQAFAAARAEVGPGGAFVWHGNPYNTYRDTEWNNMSQSERLEFSNQATAAAHHQDNGNHYAQNTDNHTSGYNNAEPAVVETVNDSEVEVVVLGVEHDYDTGMNVGAVAIDGEEIVLADVTGDGSFDFAIADLNGDGQIQDNEVQDISDMGLTVNGLLDNSVDNPVYYAANMDSNTEPDFVNDADVSGYMA